MSRRRLAGGMRIVLLGLLLLAAPVTAGAVEPMEVLWSSTDHADWAADPFPAGDGGLLVAREGGTYQLVRFGLDSGWEVLAEGSGRLEDPVVAGDEPFVVGVVDAQRRLLRLDDGSLSPALASGTQSQPAVFGEAVVFVGEGDEADNVFRWADGRVEPMAPNKAAQLSPTMDDTFVAWTDTRSATPLFSLAGPETSRMHPNNIDIYARHLPSGNVFPVAEENNQQDSPRFAGDHRLVYRSFETDVGRVLFMRDLGSQAGAGRVAVAPEATRVGAFAAEGRRVVFVDGPENASTVQVWDLDARALVGSIGPISSVIGIEIAGRAALVEHITATGSVVDAVRLPSKIDVAFADGHRTGDAYCFEARISGTRGSVLAWIEPSQAALDVRGDRISGCLQAGEGIRVADDESMTALLMPTPATPGSPTPSASAALLLLALLVLARQGR